MTPGRALAKMRAEKLRADDRAKLDELVVALRRARERRKVALGLASRGCARARVDVKAKVIALRAAEHERLKREIKEMRLRARAQCQARKHRIRSAGGSAVQKRSALIRAERQLQAQLKRLEAAAKAKRIRFAASKKERRQESDDAVRGNLPRELRPVFDAMKKTIHGSQRRTRTEAFLEWAEEHPEEVLQMQSHEADREVARLVAEHESTRGRLRKGRRHYVDLALKAVPF
jgi:hypothetical protein